VSRLRPVGFVTGLAAEARVLRRAARDPEQRDLIRCAGADAGRAKALAEELLARSVWGLISFGVAGGLGSTARPGALLLAKRVVSASGEVLDCDAAWRARLEPLLRAAGLIPLSGSLLGSDAMVGSVAEKRRLSKTSGAIAVDMESHAVGAAAQAAGVPFLALRAIADPAERALPRAVQTALDAEGRSRPARVLAGLLIRPWEAPSVLNLAGDMNRALATLARAAKVSALLG